jgi:hypothetical protein
MFIGLYGLGDEAAPSTTDITALEVFGQKPVPMPEKPIPPVDGPGEPARAGGPLSAFTAPATTPTTTMITSPEATTSTGFDLTSFLKNNQTMLLIAAAAVAAFLLWKSKKGSG